MVEAINSNVHACGHSLVAFMAEHLVVAICSITTPGSKSFPWRTISNMLLTIKRSGHLSNNKSSTSLNTSKKHNTNKQTCQAQHPLMTPQHKHTQHITNIIHDCRNYFELNTKWCNYLSRTTHSQWLHDSKHKHNTTISTQCNRVVHTNTINDTYACVLHVCNIWPLICGILYVMIICLR